MKLTNFSARQIRYYEEHNLVNPVRSEGNRRLYSLNDIDVLLKIRDYLATGLNMAGIRKVFEENEQAKKEQRKSLKKTLTDEDVRRIFRDEFLNQGFLHQSLSSIK